jgi:hypothetical protein
LRERDQVSVLYDKFTEDRRPIDNRLAILDGHGKATSACRPFFAMSYRIHPAAKEEYLNSIRWMIAHHYDRHALARFIDEIETGFVAIDRRPTDFPADPSGRPGWRFYGPTDTFRYVLRFIEDIRGKPYVMAVNAPQRRPGYWKNRKPKV